MTEPAPHGNAPSSEGPSIWRNWISVAGLIIASGSVFAFLFLLFLDLLGRGSSNAYAGILSYVVAPFFTFLGLILIFGGAWQQRRSMARSPELRPQLAIDLTRPRDRRIAGWFCLAGATFLLMTAMGSYQTYVFTESDQFCGAVCHTPMGPEFTAYQRSPHARVDCVECHVGSGPAWYVKAKINGTRQLFLMLTHTYDTPIPVPVRNLRPARETCERCHWPNKFDGSVERSFNHYLTDDGNTPYSVRMMVRIGGFDPSRGPVGGIHWHINSATKVEYYATDPQRQKIPWVRVTHGHDAPVVYRTDDFKGDPDPSKIRVMDCIDCHNRPAHRYYSPDDAVDTAMYLGRIDSRIPGIKKVAVDLLTKGYPTTPAADAALADGLHKRYGNGPQVDGTVQAVQAVFRDNIFPEMKADWTKYPDNIGHLDTPGCFRCHDGKHIAAGGSPKMPATDCNSCHIILAQGSGADLEKIQTSGLPFKHPATDIDGLGLLCSDCHNGKLQDN